MIHKKQYLSFQSYYNSNYLYAIPVLYITEIIEIKKNQITKFPSSEKLSFTNFKNRIIPVFSLKKLKSHKNENNSNFNFLFKKMLKIAILNYKEKTFGILIYPNFEIIFIKNKTKLEKAFFQKIKKNQISHIGQDKKKNRFLIPNLNLFWNTQKKTDTTPP